MVPRHVRFARMADPEGDEELRADVRRLTHRLEETTRQLGSLRIHVTSWVALAFLLAALIVPAYSEFDDGDVETDSADITLFTLVGEAGDVDNGTVRLLAIATFGGTVLAMVMTLLAIIDKRRTIAWNQAALAGLLLVVWFALTLAVGSSEGEGAIDELGYDATVRTLLLPVGAVMVLVASRVSRQVREI